VEYLSDWHVGEGGRPLGQAVQRAALVELAPQAVGQAVWLPQERCEAQGRCGGRGRCVQRVLEGGKETPPSCS
jgi:hypothetical protein